MTAVFRRMFHPRAHLAAISLLSFIAAFTAARVFTTFFPSTVLVGSGIHIHHFWFGIALLAIGGWLGISYNDRDTDRLAAILYGAGGGLIVDEVGLLLTFGEYWTSLTYTFLIGFLAFIAVLILFYAYRQTVSTELKEFLGSKASIYFGVFLFAISIAFVTQTENTAVVFTSSALAVAAVVICVAYIVLWLRKESHASV